MLADAGADGQRGREDAAGDAGGVGEDGGEEFSGAEPVVAQGLAVEQGVGALIAGAECGALAEPGERGDEAGP